MSIFIYGLTQSVTLMLYGYGFSLVYGISGIANFAHGGFYVLGGYITWCIINLLGLSQFTSAVLTVLIMGFLGFVFYWGILLRIRGIILSELVITFVAGIAILEFLNWKGLYGFYYNLLPFVEGDITVGEVSVDYQRLIVLCSGAVLAGLMWLFVHHTKIGLSFRGIAQEERTALSLGIESDWVGSLSMALGSALAAVAAILILPLGVLEANVGYEVLIYAVTVAIVGGLESTPGMVLASFIIGFGQILVAEFIGSSWMIIVPLATIVVILALRPSGLFGKFKELEERV
ncbi:MAG TPA: branched-chain amino acid ABC transporter permease [Syntrophales bacterium]|nr:branched-chain amino acid ABC transporter permease [Syntrophales bacterium]HOX94482.1 branched-chain amino acid ABC transporter permease [Syntrophales bacterium]HPN25619.1 branched-chain amino acid ABC transporter permease [Syntrophales bacterium]HQM28123.1 branched-chain amino acid ABC transporter permease [Syntrophales bacterium]